MRLIPGNFRSVGSEIGPSFEDAQGAIYFTCTCSTGKTDYGVRVFRQVGQTPGQVVDIGLDYIPYHMSLTINGGKLYATAQSNDPIRIDRVLVPDFLPPQG